VDGWLPSCKPRHLAAASLGVRYNTPIISSRSRSNSRELCLTLLLLQLLLKMSQNDVHLFIWAKFNNFCIFFNDCRVSWWPVVDVAGLNMFFSTVAIFDMYTPFNDVAPVRTLTKVIRKSLEQWADIRASRKLNVCAIV